MSESRLGPLLFFLLIAACKSNTSPSPSASSATSASTSTLDPRPSTSTIDPQPSTSTSTSTIDPRPSTSTSTSTATQIPTAPPAWPDAKRVASVDGSFSVSYPSKIFTKTSAKGDTVSLTSDVFEHAGMGPGTAIFGMRFTKLKISKIAAMKAALDADSFRQAFPHGTEAPFVPIPDFVDAEIGAAGARGYRESMGVEGIGDIVRVFSTGDGATWRADCDYCCGMIDKPKMTADAQMALCEDVVHGFQAAH
ncbi:MAG: hypothetical protein ACRELY_29870 [Polyangiaceae bacterium]